MLFYIVKYNIYLYVPIYTSLCFIDAYVNGNTHLFLWFQTSCWLNNILDFNSVQQIILFFYFSKVT